jgi:hypothetical protein
MVYNKISVTYLTNTARILMRFIFSTLKMAPMPKVKRPDMDAKIVLLPTVVYAKLAFVV